MLREKEGNSFEQFYLLNGSVKQVNYFRNKYQQPDNNGGNYTDKNSGSRQVFDLSDHFMFTRGNKVSYILDGSIYNFYRYNKANSKYDSDPLPQKQHTNRCQRMK